jgi:CubicO group peptidase (beta-lactamase class C family)
MQSRRPVEKGLPWILLIVLFLAVFLGLPVLSAPQKGFSVEKRQAIEKAVAGFMSRNNVPGLSAAVVLNGKPYWSQGFGTADLENYSPATSSTLFRLGSLS